MVKIAQNEFQTAEKIPLKKWLYSVKERDQVKIIICASVQQTLVQCKYSRLHSIGTAVNQLLRFAGSIGRKGTTKIVQNHFTKLGSPQNRTKCSGRKVIRSSEGDCI